MSENPQMENRVAKIEREVAELKARFDAMKISVDALTRETKAQTSTLGRIEHSLTSNDVHNPGIGVRLIRIEDGERRRLWWLQRIAAAVITMAASGLGGWVVYLIKHS